MNNVDPPLIMSIIINRGMIRILSKKANKRRFSVESISKGILIIIIPTEHKAKAIVVSWVLYGAGGEGGGGRI